MSDLYLPWPYAAKAIIQHEWDSPDINLWITFRLPMDQTVKPAHAKWKCQTDGGNRTVTTSYWVDAYTMKLIAGPVFANPGECTLEYDGPDITLRTTWNKQWEPWGPILSLDILT